ncbi:MAG: hypothetical protein ABIE74_03780 [Pseudomonadota bacterium]
MKVRRSQLPVVHVDDKRTNDQKKSRSNKTYSYEFIHKKMLNKSDQSASLPKLGVVDVMHDDCVVTCPSRCGCDNQKCGCNGCNNIK